MNSIVYVHVSGVCVCVYKCVKYNRMSWIKFTKKKFTKKKHYGVRLLGHYRFQVKSR